MAGCVFKPGNGQGGSTKFLVTTSTSAACAAYVLGNEPAANGATWGSSNKRCYAEFRQTSRDHKNDAWLNCQFSFSKLQAGAAPCPPKLATSQLVRAF